MASDASAAPFRPIGWAKREIDVERRACGTVILSSRLPLGPASNHVPEWLETWARERPDTTWLAQRNEEGGWTRITYAEAKRKVDCLTQALLDLTRERSGPVAILSENSIAHALMTLAAMQARLPAAPISPAYSLMSSDHAKLKYVFDLLEPAVVYVEDGARFDKALAAIGVDLPVVYNRSPPRVPHAVPFASMAETEPTEDVARSIAAIEPDTVAKYLLTSGSTGAPKAVINTQRMLCVNRAMLAQVRQIPLPDGERAMLEWLPWNHTMAGNGSFGYVLSEGLTMYLDDGRPAPGMFERTIRNLHEISPITYSSVPLGYAALANALEGDAEFCRRFFANLTMLGYAGARLPDDLYDRLQALAVRTTGSRVPFVSYYGATEGAPLIMMTYWNTEKTGYLGLPVPGMEIKMVPFDGTRYELRMRAASVTPGYHKRADLTAAAFDEEGFCRLGDLATFADPEDVDEGLMFAGRLSEEFKLLTGTFVPASELRVGAIGAASPLILDAVVTGHDRDYVGLLVWLDIAAARNLVGDIEATAQQLVAAPSIRDAVRAGLARWNARQGGSSSRTIARALLLTEPPSVDAGEITDKAYVNQRAVLDRRQAEVGRLHADLPADDVIVIDRANVAELVA